MPFEVPLVGISYQRRVVCVGDSFTGSPGRALTSNYPRTLGAMLGRHAYCMNLGVGGDTIARINARFTADVRDNRPLDCVVLAGMNDLQTGRAAAEIIPDLDALYTSIATINVGPNARAVTLLPFGSWGGWTVDREAVRREVNDWIRTRPLCTDAETMGDGDPVQPSLLPAFTSDGLHLNPTGQTKLARLIFTESFGRKQLDPL